MAGDNKVLYAPVSVELHREARIRALEEGRSVGGLVAEAVERYLKGSLPTVGSMTLSPA
jgi:hypothetical protein